MRILWLSHLVPYPPRSGVAQRSYGLLKEICKSHEVDLIALHQPNLMKAMSNDPVDELERAAAHLRSLCSRVEILPIPSERSEFARRMVALRSLCLGQSFTQNWLASSAYARVLAELDASKYDVAHFDTISLAPYRRHLRRSVCVMNHHNVESHLLLRRSSKSPSLVPRLYFRHEGNRLRAYEARMAPAFALHLTCSDLDTERLRELAPGLRCAVVPNGVDIDYFAPSVSAEPAPTFCFVGSLGWGPNREAAEILARNIWPAIASAWPDATMTLVGSDAPDVARALAAKDPRFQVTGFVEDVRPFMARASFFVCPIRDGGGTKLKVLNALAMGKVVVADPIACEGISVDDGRDVLFASSGAEYVARIRSMLEHPERYRSIAQAGRALIEREYSYAVVGRMLERQYEGVRAA